MILANLKTKLITGLAVLLAVVGLGLASTSLVGAQNTTSVCSGANINLGGDQDCDEKKDGSERDKSDTDRLNELVTNIINVFSIIVGIVAVIMIIVGGFNYITSGGDSGKVTSARNTIIYALVGLIIVAFAQIIVRFVLARLTNDPS